MASAPWFGSRSLNLFNTETPYSFEDFPVSNASKKSGLLSLGAQGPFGFGGARAQDGFGDSRKKESYLKSHPDHPGTRPRST